MMFLIAKMFFYLLTAGLIGAGAGWLLRNLQSQRVEELAARDVAEAKTKLPQMESLLRGRDEQVNKLKAQLAEAKTQIKEHGRALIEAERTAQKQERELARLQRPGSGNVNMDISELDASPGVEAVADSDCAQQVTLLSAEVDSLRAQLAQAQHVSGEADTELMRVECEALAGRLKATEAALDTARRDLELEQQKVRDLERERQLQNRSLQVLNQQLELARRGRVAGG